MANDEQNKVAKKKTAKKAAAKKSVAKKASTKATAKKSATKKAPVKAQAAEPAQASPKKSGKKMRVTLVKSLIGTIGRHRDTVRGLGLRRVNHTVEVEDSPATRGMVNKVNYLVRVEKD